MSDETGAPKKNIVHGRVTLPDGTGIPELIVTLYDIDPKKIPEDFPTETQNFPFGDLYDAGWFPGGKPDFLNLIPRRMIGERIGSVITDQNGSFELSYDDSEFRVRVRVRDGVEQHPELERRPDLMLVVLGPETPWEAWESRIAYFSVRIRANAGLREGFIIRLTEKDLKGVGALAPSSPVEETHSANVLTPAQFTSNVEARAATYDQIKAHTKEMETQRAAVRDDFRQNIAPFLRDELSTISGDDADIDPDLVTDEASVRQHAEARMLAVVEDSLSVDASEPMTLSGTISLTEEQLAKIEEVGNVDDETVTIGEQELTRILREEGEGTNPETDQSSVTRVEAIVDYCRKKTKGEECLFDDSEPHSPGSDQPGPNGELDIDSEDEPTPDNEPRSNGGSSDPDDGRGNSLEKEDIVTYIAEILNEQSELDSGLEGLPGPGDQLSENDVANEDVFPLFSLPPGSPEGDSIHDFHRLQIAFKPVWMQAIDESLIEDAEAAYERYVELGGDTTDQNEESVQSAIVAWGNLNLQMNATFSLDLSKPPVVVIEHIDITTEEYLALPGDHRTELYDIAEQINNI